MRIIKTRSSFGRFTTSLELPVQKPNLNHTTLFIFTEIPDSESPIKHCKHYLDTFKEPLQQKTFFIRQPILSKSITLQRNISENERIFKNYERMVSYSTKKHSLQHVQRKLLKNNKANKNRLNIPSLKQIVSNKMIEELASQMNLTNNEEKIQTVLKDQRQKQQLFEESILVDRLLFIKQQARKTKDNQHISKIEYNPKHFHLNQLHRDIDIFYRRKFVKKHITFNCESKISQFQLTKFRQKCEQSQILMKHLINNYSNQINTDKNGHNLLIMQTIKRLFLHYSNKDGATEYSHKYISRDNLHRFFKDFAFTQLISSIKDDFLLKERIDGFNFSEIIFQLSSLMSKTTEYNVYQFLKKHIIVKEQKYIPNQCLQYNKRLETIHKYFKVSKIKKKVQIICDSLSKVGANDSNGQRWLNFDSFHELFLNLKIYPNHISKSKMKYYHLYCQSINQVINIDHIMQILAFISLKNEKNYQNTLFQLIDLIKKFQL